MTSDIQDFLYSATAMAETYLGDYNRYKEILDINPQLLGYKLPPSLQAPIDTLAKLGIKVPNVDQLQKAIDGEDKRLTAIAKGLFRDVDKTVTAAGVEGVVKEARSQLTQLSWLF